MGDSGVLVCQGGVTHIGTVHPSTTGGFNQFDHDL